MKKKNIFFDKIIKTFLFLISVFLTLDVKCQEINFTHLFDSTIKGNKSTNINMSFDKILAKAETGNSLYFMELGSFINANNIQFQNTGDKIYLENNLKIVTALSKNSDNNHSSIGNVWRLKSSNSTKLSKYDENEYVLFEGYLFRYVSEFFYVAKQNNFSMGELKISFLENNFDKWYDRSIAQYGDLSLLIKIRLHMGAQWGTTALYLYKLNGKSRYLNFYNDFNSILKSNLKLKQLGNKRFYVWNSSYDNKKINKLVKDRYSKGLDANGEIQDVSHGNHVVQFIIDSQNLNMGNWSKSDLLLLANTIKYSIWDNDSKTFSDNVDGSSNKDKSLKGSGWKQADGWMKLLTYDKSLYDIYLSFYRVNLNKVKINKSTGNLQFYANMLAYRKIFGGKF